MKITLTAKDIVKNGDWEMFCEARNVYQFCDSDEKFELSLKEIKTYGLSDSILVKLLLLVESVRNEA